jgi:hypothetical protein
MSVDAPIYILQIDSNEGRPSAALASHLSRTDSIEGRSLAALSRPFSVVLNVDARHAAFFSAMVFDSSKPRRPLPFDFSSGSCIEIDAFCATDALSTAARCSMDVEGCSSFINAFPPLTINKGRLTRH